MEDINTTKISDGQGQGENILMISSIAPSPESSGIGVSMRELYLTRGKVAIVDDEDWEQVSSRAWCVTRMGEKYYAASNFWQSREAKYKLVTLHAFLMNTPKGMHTDHINGDTMDNRRENLRICTPQQNIMNKAIARCNKVGYKGIRVSGRKFMGFIGKDKKIQYLGTYDSALEAAKAYNWAAAVLFGEYAYLNKI